MITMGARGKGGDDGGEVLEFTVVGTAVKAPWINHPPNRPVLTDLSGQELWALYQDGFEPCGFVFDYCRYQRLARDELRPGSTPSSRRGSSARAARAATSGSR